MLTTGAQAATDLSVRVTEAGRESAVEQVKLELVKFAGEVVQTVFSDSNGNGEFRGIAASPSYTIRASKADYRTTEVAVESEGSSGHQVSLQMPRARPLPVSSPGKIVSVRSLTIPRPAAKEFRKAIALLNEKRDARRSIERLRKAVALFPGYFEAYFLMAMAHLQLQSPTEAESALRKAIELDARFIEPYYPLAVLLEARKKYAEAEGLLSKAMQLDRHGWRWPFELARCKAGQQRWQEALAYGKSAHDRPGAPSKVHLLMADLYSGLGSLDRAIEELQEFAKVDPHSTFMPRVRRLLLELRARQ